MKIEESLYVRHYLHRKRFENKLWMMFDRARKERPDDNMLAFAILREIDRLIDQPYSE